jgi:hypothetical protein
MAPPVALPLDTTGDFEVPPEADEADANAKEVTWSATPKENKRETIEKRKTPVCYQISPHLSVKNVLKETHAMFKKTDPTFLMISKEDSSVVIRNAADLDKYPADELKKYFPASLIKRNTSLNLFVITDRSIHRLKKDSFGFYEHASKHICVSDNPFQSDDVQNIGFFLHKSGAKIDKAYFTRQVIQRLSDFPFSDDDSSRHDEAKEALPFEVPLPKFELRACNNIYHASAAGRVKTTAITIHCDQKHVNFFSRLLIRYHETEGYPPKQFVPHSLLHGNDTINKKACRNAIILQNKHLAEMRIIPVVGVSRKALQETIRVGNSPPQSVINLILKYKYFTSIEPTSKSTEIGLYFFVTTATLFDQAKQFTVETIPKIWSKLENNFLDELPPSIKCPRLTTSNLKDAATSRTADPLANSIISDDASNATKWSNAPHRPPTQAVIVNYSDNNFPSLPAQRRGNRNSARSSQEPNEQQTASAPLDNASSTHSKTSAASAGTTFTREGGISLFTSLSESFMADVKSQSDAMLAIVEQQKLDRLEHKEEQRLARAEQAAVNEQTNLRFMQMLEAFAQHSTQGATHPNTLLAQPTAQHATNPHANIQIPIPPCTPATASAPKHHVPMDTSSDFPQPLPNQTVQPMDEEHADNDANCADDDGDGDEAGDDESAAKSHDRDDC